MLERKRDGVFEAFERKTGGSARSACNSLCDDDFDLAVVVCGTPVDFREQFRVKLGELQFLWFASLIQIWKCQSSIVSRIVRQYLRR